MKGEPTQLLFAWIVALMTVQLFVPSSVDSNAQAFEETVPAVLRARTIELVDERGLNRDNLKTEEDGTVVFRMMDAKGTILVKLAAS